MYWVVSEYVIVGKKQMQTCDEQEKEVTVICEQNARMFHTLLNVFT